MSRSKKDGVGGGAHRWRLWREYLSHRLRGYPPRGPHAKHVTHRVERRFAKLLERVARMEVTND